MNLGDVFGAAQGIGLPGGVTVESALLPPLTLLRPDGGGGDGPPQPPPLWLQIVRPKITAQTIAGNIVVAPAGDPPGFPWLGVVLLAGAAGLVAFAVVGAVHLARR